MHALFEPGVKSGQEWNFSRLRGKRVAHPTYPVKPLKSVDDILQDYNASKTGKLKVETQYTWRAHYKSACVSCLKYKAVQGDGIAKEIDKTSDLKRGKHRTCDKIWQLKLR